MGNSTRFEMKNLGDANVILEVNVIVRADDKGDVSTRDNGSCLGRLSRLESDLGRASCRVISLCLSPNNCSACLYTVTFDGRAVTSCYPLSQGSLPYKSKLSCIFLAAETLSIPISRRS
ncbi:hypothetical protein V6N13_015225 [Hibiscus sabdariffa]